MCVIRASNLFAFCRWHTSASHPKLLIHIQRSNDKREKTKIPLSRARTNKIVRDVASILKADLSISHRFHIRRSFLFSLPSSLSLCIDFPFIHVLAYFSSNVLLQVSPLLENVLMMLFDGFGELEFFKRVNLKERLNYTDIHYRYSLLNV